MFLVDAALAAAWDDLSKHILDILKRNGAEVIGLTRWDERKLAYTVEKQKRGTYVLAFFCLADGGAVAEIEHDCRLSEKVLRTLILRADHFTVGGMRMQLGEDFSEDVGKKLAEERGEDLSAAHAPIVAKPAGSTEGAPAAKPSAPAPAAGEAPPPKA
jgi:small subunit ribosomal protein S6